MALPAASCSRSRSPCRCVSAGGFGRGVRVIARRLFAWSAVAAGLLFVGALSLTALAAKERDNRFCISCHAPTPAAAPQSALHEEKFKRFTEGPPTDLAGLHHLTKPEIGCIECHGGADPIMRGKVWAIAGWDTVRYLVGAYEEPVRMRLPLRDAECRQCHAPIVPPASARPAAVAPPAPPAAPVSSSPEASYTIDPHAEGRRPTSYHAIREHDTVTVQCATCHTSHTTAGSPKDRFISHDVVRPICRECHKQM